MEKETKSLMSKTVKVGTVVVLAFLLFVTAIFVVGRQQNLFGSTVPLRTVFSGVSGLQVGNNVRFNGINIGTVSDIIIMTDTSVMVRMVIEKEMQRFIRKNSKCIIGSEGLMGDKVITISSGTEEFEQIGDKDILLSEAPVEMDQIVAGLKSTVENAEVISEELALIMYKINYGQGSLARLLADSSMATDISNTLENLKSSSENLDENLEALKKSFLLRGAIRKMEKEHQEQNEKNKK